MKILSNLTILIICLSCASSQKGSKHYSDVKNEDFKPAPKIPYLRSKDVLSNVKSDLTSALNNESLSRIMPYDGDFDPKDDLDKIAQLCHAGDFSKAYALVKDKSRSYIKNPIFWNQVGNCFLLEKKFRKALLFYNRALAINDDYVPALNNLGVMYLQKGDQTRALVAFKKAINADSYAKTPRFNLASLFLSYGLHTEAKKQLLVLQKESQTDIDILNMLATTFLMEGNAKEAVSSFSKIKSKYTSRIDIGTNYALALYLSGDKSRARSIMSDIDKGDNSHWTNYKKIVQGILGE